MEDRLEIGRFKQEMKSGEVQCSAVCPKHSMLEHIASFRNEARACLKQQVELAPTKEVLQKVLNKSLRTHLASYESIMAGIAEEGLFDAMSSVATASAATAHATALTVYTRGKPVQRAEAADDVDVLYADAKFIAAAFVKFLQTLHEKTHACE